MKKTLIWMVAVIFVVSLTITGVGCKEEAAPAEEEAVEEAAPVEEEAAEEEEMEEEAVEEVAEEEAAVEKTFYEMIQDGEFDFSGITINYLFQGGVAYDDYITACVEEFEH